MTRNGAQWLCVCDFDGTITTNDATDQLLDAFASRSWQDIEGEWKAGLIGSQECLARQVALINATRGKIAEFANSITIDPHFSEFVKLCETHGVRLVIVSDGLDCIIEPVLRRYRLGHIPVFSNVLLTQPDGRHALVSPYQDPACSARSGTCKCGVIDSLCDDLESSSVLYVGDGLSDFCGAIRMAKVIAAKSSLAAHLSRLRKPYYPFESFRDVQVLISQLVADQPSQSGKSV